MSIRFCLIILLLFSFRAGAQTDFSVGLLPNWNYGIKVADHWKINGKVESRINSFGRDTLGEFTSNWGFELVDVQAGASYKLRPNQAFNLSFLIRYRDDAFFYRSIQQYSLVKNFEIFNLGQRIRTDQTFSQNGFNEFRLRYRLTFLIPLSGSKINAMEPYIKVNNEYLFGINESIEFDPEIRIAPAFGFSFDRTNKLELGLDYRYSDFILFDASHQLWLSLGWYYTF